MRDDPEYWDALSSRIVATIREQRQSSWLRLSLWVPSLATAAAFTLILASRHTTATAPDQAPRIAAMLTAPGQAPSIASMLRQP